jgi:molybdate transport system substrate-binding protein
MKTFLVIAFFICIIPLRSQTVKIAAAADLKFAMPEMIERFRVKYPGARIEVSYGSSGLLFQQISNGAGFDLFFSADISYPRNLKVAGLVEGEVHTYAFGVLVLYTTSVKLNRGIEVLKDAQVPRIAIANPKHAPYGKRAEEFLKNIGVYPTIKSKLIFGDNISQTGQFALTGNADVAFLALSIAISPEFKNKGNYIILDKKSYSAIEQGCVQLKKPQLNTSAGYFLQFILSAECKPIFEKYGFRVQ